MGECSTLHNRRWRSDSARRSATALNTRRHKGALAIVAVLALPSALSPGPLGTGRVDENQLLVDFSSQRDQL